jgi:DNA polymerase/3'-5' exonuclease PolX
MTDDTIQTLAAIERCLLAGDTNSTKALKAAYELGRMDGLLDMAKVGEQKAADLLKEAA